MEGESEESIQERTRKMYYHEMPYAVAVEAQAALELSIAAAYAASLLHEDLLSSLHALRNQASWGLWAVVPWE